MVEARYVYDPSQRWKHRRPVESGRVAAADRLTLNASCGLPRREFRTVAPVPRRAKHLLFSRNVSIPRRKNKSVFENQKQAYISSRPALPTEGVSRSLRHVARDAMDAHLPQKRAAGARTAKPCGPDPPTLGSSLVDDESVRRWWLKSPVHQGERGVSRKAIAQGVPDVFGFTCSDYAGGPSLCCPLGYGCGQRPAFPAPSV